MLSTFFLRHTTLIIGFVTLHFEIVCLKLVSGLSNDICIIKNVPRLCNRVEYIIYYPFSFFFSPNPPIKWIQMNFSHKPNAVLLSLKCSLLRRYKDIHLLCGDCAHRCNALSIHKNESFYLFYERAI